ncbi:MAG: sulfotransferase [Candidatus Acidiferrales bacterium]
MPAPDSLRLPDFIGVGPPRTATTWVHEALVGHVGLPQGVKETDFFVWRYNKGLKWYAAHFRDCSPARPIGEFSPNYFVSVDARERIAKDIPGCKIICTLRDPVERTYSHYRKMREGEYFSGSFEECLEKRPRVIEWSKYGSYVRAWRRLFHEENVLILIQDDLKANSQAFLNQVCDFIRIPRIEVAKSKSKDNLVNAIPRLPRNARLARAARLVRDGLQKRGNYAIVNLLKRTGLRDYLFSGGPSFEPLRAETEVRLREIFRPEVEDLEEMLGRDLSAWKTPHLASAERSRSG